VSTWIALFGIAVGSYLFRVAPLVLLDRIAVPRTVERSLGYAATSAMTALVVSSVVQHQRTADAASSVAALMALGLAGWLAARKRPFAIAVAAGTGFYAATSALIALVT
jgi:branched-subunit amino acid transport protein